MVFRVVLLADPTKEVLTTTPQLLLLHLPHNIIKNSRNRKTRREGRRLLHRSQRCSLRILSPVLQFLVWLHLLRVGVIQDLAIHL